MKRIKIEANSIEEASAAYSAMRDASGEGASTWPCGEWNGKHISYNGKVWENSNWQSGDQPIYNPYQ